VRNTDRTRDINSIAQTQISITVFCRRNKGQQEYPVNIDSLKGEIRFSQTNKKLDIIQSIAALGN
jgi:hypothetical protein